AREPGGRPVRAIVQTAVQASANRRTSAGTIVAVVLPNEMSRPGWSRARTRQHASVTSNSGNFGERGCGHRAMGLGAPTPAYDSRMRVVFLTGIWPPDIGGPATHGPDFAAFLRDRGHSVHVVTMGDGEATERPVPVETVSRSRPFVSRYTAVAAKGFRLARDADVVYATATYAAAAVAAVRRPFVAKLVSDPAYERAWRYGIFRESLESFAKSTDPRLAVLRRLRTPCLRPPRRGARRTPAPP